MKKKIVGIFVCMLLICTVLPVSGNVTMETTSKSSNYEFVDLNTEIYGIAGFQSFSVQNNEARLSETVDSL